jgi:hypothetical protein
VKSRFSIRSRREAGVALLIAIFVLLLICVVGIALMVASGTESALAGNYRSATGVYYAALAGLEEGRGRLLPRNLNYFNKKNGNFMPASGTTLAYGDVRYITNPAGGENVLIDYPDNEYLVEFGASPPSTPAPVGSVSTVAGIQGPLYKWVRINAVTEKSLNLDVNGNGNGDQKEPLFFDGAHLTHNATPGFQAFEITALAALPNSNGSQKILQYVVAPVQMNLNFPAALTLAGNNVTFSGPPDSPTYPFQITGNDQLHGGTCGTPKAAVPAIGLTSGTTPSSIANTPPLPHPSQYTGVPPSAPLVPPTPSIRTISGELGLSPSLETPAGFDSAVQSIMQNADAVITGPADQSNLPPDMSPSNPRTVFIQGDPGQPSQGNFNLTGGFTGYGLLVVTGTFTYSGDSGWKGIVLVVGQGKVIETGGAGGNEFDGAILIANTRDSSGALLPGNTLGAASYTLANPGGNGIYYNSCWIKTVLPIISYQALSFHEISQQ